MRTNEQNHISPADHAKADPAWGDELARAVIETLAGSTGDEQPDNPRREIAGVSSFGVMTLEEQSSGLWHLVHRKDGEEIARQIDLPLPLARWLARRLSL